MTYEKAIIIAPYSYHKNIIEKRNETPNLVDIKIMTIYDFLTNLNFNYDEKTILYLMDKYNIKYSLATFYLKLICTLADNLPIKWLKDMMDDLKKQNLLKENIFFKDDLKSRKIYVYGYSHFSKYYQEILKPYQTIYPKEDKIVYEHPIYKYATLEEEINNVAIKIITLHQKNIPFSKIKIINGENYLNTIERIFKNYHLPITEKKPSIYSSIIVKTFLEELTDPIEDTLKILADKFNLKNEENNQIYNQIIDLLNKYSFVNSYQEIKECLKEELKKIQFKNNLQETIECTNLEIPIVEDNYYFIIGMNQNVFPILKKDDDFLSDEIKSKIGLETAYEYNENELNYLTNKIKTIPNLWLSFHQNNGKINCLPSLICQNLNFKISENNLFSEQRFSKVEDKLSLAKAYDEWIKYGTINPNMAYLNSHLEIPYQTYNNQFTKINKNILKEHLKEITLSYTSLNTYYKCPFRYYCSFILKLDQYETTFEAFVGSVFHNVLSKAFTKNNNLDTNTLYNQAINEELDKLNNQKCQLQLTEENKNFLTFLKEDINFVVNTIKEQLKNTKLTNALFEKKITVLKTKEIPVTFKGFIDKILFLEDKNQTYIAIIDYKTGPEEIEIKNVKFGLNLQLPVYLYLSSKLEEWNNTSITGFYLQKILNKEQKQNPKYTYDQLKKEALKLEGYTNSNLTILEKLEPNYLNSQLIKGLRFKNDGSFYSNVKTLSNEKMQQLIKYVDKKIDEASNNIIEGNFEIKPKRIDNKNKSCEYCPFKELCYLEEKDFENLTSPNNLDFLGGEEFE